MSHSLILVTSANRLKSPYDVLLGFYETFKAFLLLPPPLLFSTGERPTTARPLIRKAYIFFHLYIHTNHTIYTIPRYPASYYNIPTEKIPQKILRY